MSLAERLLAGDRRALARLITQVENRDVASRPALAALHPHTGRAHMIGVTGAPGSGKSSLVNELARTYRQRDMTVGIIAVDPSSPFSGGAILGDRIRMRDLAGDPGIFIRSMASRGSLGGLAAATADVARLLDAAGYDKVFIETVGAGQAEVDIARTAHTTLVIEVPGLGDDVQAIKAGLLEIADIFVVNKADREGAEAAVRTLESMLALGVAEPGRTLHHGSLLDIAYPPEMSEASPDPNDAQVWSPPICKTVASNGEGVGYLVETIESHLSHLRESGQLEARARLMAATELETILRQELLAEILHRVERSDMSALIDKIANREIDPYTAAARLMSR